MGPQESLRIPISAFTNERETERILKQARDAASDLGVRVVSSEEWLQMATGIQDVTASIIMRYFEMTERLFSQSYVALPSSEKQFNPEVIQEAEKLGLEAVEVRGYSGVPKLVDLLKRHEIDVGIFTFLWSYIAPDIPAPLSYELARARTDWYPHFLDALIGEKYSDGSYGAARKEDARSGGILVETNGTTPYLPRFDHPDYILVEGFDEPLIKDVNSGGEYRNAMQERIPARESKLLDILGITRAGMTKHLIEEAIRERGETALRIIGLDPNIYRIHPIRFEDYLRVGVQKGWGASPYHFYLDGWLNAKGKPLALHAGRSWDTDIYELKNRGYGRGLTTFEIDDADHEYPGKYDFYLVRLCISARQ